MILYVDLDEVFADFIGGACRLHGVSTPNVRERCRDTGSWDIEGAIAAELNKTGLTKTELWKPILQQEYDFWYNLEPLPWAWDLKDLLDASEHTWYLVSSPFNSGDCHVAKIDWIHKFFGERFDRFLLTPYKYLLAQRGTLLIDDSPKNVNLFRYNGGLSYLFGSSPLATIEANKDPLKDLVQNLKGHGVSL